MWRVSEKQHTPILTGIRALAADREWEVEVVPLVAGQRSVKEKEWLESFKVFGIGKLFGSYCRHTFGPFSSLLQLLRKGRSVRTSQLEARDEG
jgi:hypothetical protein